MGPCTSSTPAHRSVRTPILPEEEVRPVKAKKSFVLIVVTLVLVAVALLLPAAAFGKADANNNKALNWVTYGGNSNNIYIDTEGWQGGSSQLVKQLTDLSTVGHLTIHTMKDGSVNPHFRASTTEFDQSATSFYEGEYYEPWSEQTFTGKIAIFVAVFAGEDFDQTADVHMMWVSVDGGEPFKVNDVSMLYFWGADFADPESGDPGPEMWLPFFNPEALELGVGSGNIQVHLGPTDD